MTGKVASEQVRVALHGAGWISMAHAAAARFNGFELVAVASRTAERAAKQAEQLGARAVTYADLPGDADVVVVATPPQCHADDAIRLLEAGAAVLLEKPLCTTLDDADRIVDAAADHGQRLLYAENLAYAPIVQQLLVRTGELGPLTHLEVRTLQGLPTWGAFTSDEWGGGALFDLGVHPLAIALLAAGVSGAGRPIAVSAVLRGGEGHGSDEHAEVQLTFRTGLVATVVSSWQGGPDPVWDVQAASATGTVRAELLPHPLLEHNGDTVDIAPPSAPVPAVESFGYLGQLRALVDDVAKERAPLMSAAFGREVLDVVCAAYWSAGLDGAEVTVPFEGPRGLTPLELWRGAGRG